MADRPPSLQSLLKEISTSGQLNQRVTPTHLSEVASKLTTWQLLVPHLRLTPAEEEAIARNFPGNVELQRLKAFQKWSEKQGSKATYQKLIHVVHKVGKTELAEDIIQLLKEEDSDTDSEGGAAVPSALETYTAVVKKNYGDRKPPTVVEWPLPPTFKFLQLAMIKREPIQRGPIDDEFIQMTLRGKVDDILHHKVPVQLEQVFSITDSTERKVILIEGAPGCGKTTLLWHICQRWGEGSLFNQFKLAVLVQLRDPAVHLATSLADILPFANKELCQDVATEIQKGSQGDGLLILLDGWDEAPNHIQKASLFRTIILNPDLCSLGKSTVIVSSRPSSSLDLHPHSSARIEVVGFTQPCIEEYVRESLSSNPKEAQTLIETIKASPHLQESCYLPLYLAIVTHVFLCMGHTLPPTYCGIIMILVLSCLQRYIQKSMCNPYGDCGNLTSFKKLPSELSVQFSILCELAFKGIINDKYSFSTEELDIFQSKLSQIDCTFTLGLLQAVESFVAMGKSTTYHFLHLSIQEFCAAKYLSTLPNMDDCIDSLKKLIGSPRLWPILEFYSRITNLADQKIRSFLISLPTAHAKANLVLAQCRCLYEAQDASLCPPFGIQAIITKHCQYSISDLMAVSYFISHSSTVVCLKLTYCGITATGAKVLADGLRGSNSIKQLDLSWNPCIGDSGVGYLVQCIESIGLEKFELWECNITTAGAKVLAGGLRGSTSIKQLNLSGNSIGDSGIGYLAQCIGSAGLENLTLTDCHITATGVKVLCDGLRGNNSIKQLHLDWNSFIGDSGIGYLAQCIGSTGLETLGLSACHITATGVKALGNGLRGNKSIKHLHLKQNSFIGDFEFGCFAQCIGSTGLEVLILERCNITATGAMALGDGLRGNNSIKTLDLSENPIGDSGVGCLAQCITTTRLEYLDLGACNITATGAKALADGLRGNEHLKSLQLHCNTIGHVGALCLTEVVRKTRLEELQLFRCAIGDEGIAAIASTLVENPPLTYLGIAGNSTTYGRGLRAYGRGLRALSQSLAKNTTLNELELFTNVLVKVLQGHIIDDTLSTSQPWPDLARTFISTLRDNNSLIKLHVVAEEDAGEDFEEVKNSTELSSVNSMRSNRGAPLLQMALTSAYSII